MLFRSAVDQTVPVGADLVVINDGASAPAPAPSAPAPVAAPVASPPATPAPVAAPVAPPVSGSAEVVVMPALGESVTEGTVTRWLKNVGDSIAMDEALLEVSTDKVDTEIPSPVAGVVSEIFAPADSVVPVGGQLAAISATGAPVKSAPSAPVVPVTPAPVAPVTAAAPTPAPAAPMNSMPAPVSRVESDSYVTPLVRKLAAELQIDLGTLAGTGVGGRIRKQDVYDAAERARDRKSTRLNSSH